MSIPLAPAILVRWMAPFQSLFYRPTWQNALVLILGTVLAPGRRTVTAALSVLGLREAATFTNFHRVLNRNRWSSRTAARRLLDLLLEAFVADGPVVIGLDETIERRWGSKIKARGIYRDPVRSSHGHFVKASGLRWITVTLLAPIPWAQRVWALPFVTALAPSERFARERGHRHKKLTDRARQLLILLARWLPERQLVAVADSSYAAIELLKAVSRHLTMITRLRLDARLFDPPPPRRPGTMGRPRVSGARQPTLDERLADPRTPPGSGSSSPAGMAARSGNSTSSPARRSGTTPASRLRSAGCWCATSPVNLSPRDSAAPTRMPIRSTCCVGSCDAGPSR